MVPVRATVVVGLVAAACSGKPKPDPGNIAAPGTGDGCVTAIDKLFGVMARAGRPADPGLRDGAIEDCRTRPDDPLLACINAAPDDAAVHQCMTAPRGEPRDELERAVTALRTYFFVHETFTEQNVPLTPAAACCTFPNQRCPAEAAPDRILTEILELDLTAERRFQYRFQSASMKAVIEAVGDLDCDGTTVTYRRELEWRDDGNMHITVTDPPAGSD
jgi:hypothetical protein